MIPPWPPLLGQVPTPEADTDPWAWVALICALAVVGLFAALVVMVNGRLADWKERGAVDREATKELTKSLDGNTGALREVKEAGRDHGQLIGDLVREVAGLAAAVERIERGEGPPPRRRGT